MNFEINMQKEAHDQIQTIMKYNDKINGGDEIGGWLTGDWDFQKDANGILKGTLNLDKFILPKQSVSTAEVDISPESMMDTIRTIGMEQANRLKAHWHIHPFNTGDTDWSSIDEDKIASFIDPVKNRQIFVFLLSSLDQLKARVEIKYFSKVKFMEQQIVNYYTINDLPVNVIGASPIDALPQEAQDMKALIDEKVTRATYETVKYDKDWWKNSEWCNKTQKWVSKDKPKDSDVAYYTIDVIKSGVMITLRSIFAKYVEEESRVDKQLLRFDSVSEGKTVETWNYKFKSKKQAKEFVKSAEGELAIAEDDFKYDINDVL